MATKTWKGDDATTPNSWSVAGNWDGGVPVNSDDVIIPAGSLAITAGLNQSAVTLDSLIVENGFDQNIGSATADLQIGTSGFEFSALGGTQYIDLGSSNIDALIKNAPEPESGFFGLYLIGSSLNTVSVDSGKVAVAGLGGQTATVDDARVIGNGILKIGSGVTLGDSYITGEGTILQYCAGTNVDVLAGLFRSYGEGAIATINAYGGELIPNSSGTVTDINHYGGAVDLTKSGIARTVTNYNVKKGASGTDLSYRIDTSIVTIGTLSFDAGMLEADIAWGA